MYLSACIRSFILPKLEIMTVNHNWSRCRAQLIIECDAKKPTNQNQNKPVPQGSQKAQKTGQRTAKVRGIRKSAVKLCLLRFVFDIMTIWQPKDNPQNETNNRYANMEGGNLKEPQSWNRNFRQLRTAKGNLKEILM